jgi:hypothetical protein
MHYYLQALVGMRVAPRFGAEVIFEFKFRLSLGQWRLSGEGVFAQLVGTQHNADVSAKL